MINLKSFKLAVHPPIYSVAAIYEMAEGYHGWLLETTSGALRFIPQEFIVKADASTYTKPGLDVIIRKHTNEREEGTTQWINSLEKVTRQHQVEQLMREIVLKHTLDDAMEQKVINAICQIEGITAHITSKAKPLTTIGTHWDHIESVTDWGVMPMDKQGREFRSIMKNAIQWKRGSIDKWKIFKPFLVAFCECPLFVGTGENKQPCCDMIATTPSGRTKMVAHYQFDSERLLRNAERFEAVDNLVEYQDIRELEPGVVSVTPRFKGTYTLGENSIRKLVSAHALKGMEFPLEKNLYTEDGRAIDILIDTRSVESKKAWSLALRSFPCPEGKNRGTHLNEVWQVATNIYSNNKMIGQAVVFEELFATTVENHLMIGDTHHSLKIRPEAHLLGGIGYDPLKVAIEPNFREIQEYAQLYGATSTIIQPQEAVEVF